MSDKGQCAFMGAAYPTLDASDTCLQHRHEPRVFALATAFAQSFQPEPTTDERIAWFLDDADAVIDDFDPTPDVWVIEDYGFPEDMHDITHHFALNGVEYVLQDSDWEPATPVKRTTWESWIGADE